MGSYSASEFFPVPFVGEVFDRFSGRETRLERVFNEVNALFQEVIDAHFCPKRPKQEQDDIVDVLLAISKKQVQPCMIVITHEIITHENIKAILFVSDFYSEILMVFKLKFYLYPFLLLSLSFMSSPLS